jgi:hypothetical protein
MVRVTNLGVVAGTERFSLNFFLACAKRRYTAACCSSYPHHFDDTRSSQSHFYGRKIVVLFLASKIRTITKHSSIPSSGETLPH